MRASVWAQPPGVNYVVSREAGRRAAFPQRGCRALMGSERREAAADCHTVLCSCAFRMVHSTCKVKVFLLGIFQNVFAFFNILTPWVVKYAGVEL